MMRNPYVVIRDFKVDGGAREAISCVLFKIFASRALRPAAGCWFDGRALVAPRGFPFF